MKLRIIPGPLPIGIQPTGPLTRKNDESFFGELGKRRYDDEKMQCHICGDFFVSVATHSYRGHSVTAAEYRKRFGLSGRGLIGPKFRSFLSGDFMRRVGDKRQTSGRQMSSEDARRMSSLVTRAESVQGRSDGLARAVKAPKDYRSQAKLDSYRRPERCAAIAASKRAYWAALTPEQRHNRNWRGAPVTCTFDGCGRPTLAKGLCSCHYQRLVAVGKKETAA